MTNPLISVLIPVYREGVILRDTIDAVMNQSFQDFEVVLVENNADELSLNILKEYAQKFPAKVRLVSQPIQGAPSARNKGLQESRGRYIAMCEGDDVMYPNRLEKQLSVFEKNSAHISLLSSEYDLVNWENDKIVEKSMKSKSFWMERLALEGIFRSHPSTWFFEKEKAISVGMFNEAFNPRLVEDDEFNFKMFLNGSLVSVPDRLVRVRLPSIDYLALKNEQAPTVQVLYKLDIFFSFLLSALAKQSTIKYDKRGFKRIRSQWLREIGVGFLSYKNGILVGRKLILDALFEEKTNLKNWKEFFRSFYRKRNLKHNQEGLLLESDIESLLRRELFSLNNHRL